MSTLQKGLGKVSSLTDTEQQVLATPIILCVDGVTREEEGDGLRIAPVPRVERDQLLIAILLDTDKVNTYIEA